MTRTAAFRQSAQSGSRGAHPMRTLAHGLVWLLLLLPARGFAQQRGNTAGDTTADSTRAQQSSLLPAAPVVLGVDTVLVLHARLGAFTVTERAAAIRARLERVAANATANADSLRVLEEASTTDIVLRDVILVAVTNADAAAAGTTRAQLAADWSLRIGNALRAQGFETRLRTIALGIVFALLVAIATVLIFRVVQRVFQRLRTTVEQRRQAMPGLRVQRLELLSGNQLADAILGALSVLRVVLIALLLYLTLPIILSFFPWTERYADPLFAWVLSPFARVWNAFIAYLPSLFTIAAISVVTWYLLRLIRLFFTGIERGNISFRGFFPEWARPTYQLVRTLVLIFAFIMAWPYLPGSDSDAFKGVGVMLGLLISFGSASAIGNVVGGIVLTYMRPFRVGDRVRISDTTGDIIEKNLLVTRIRTIKNEDITVPNSMVLGSHIINYSATAGVSGVILHTTVTIGYDAPWRQVYALLLAAAVKTEDILADPAPFVFQLSLDDFYVSYELNAYTPAPNRMAATYSALHANIQDAFNEAGVEIMSPHYRSARDGNRIAIPDEYVKPGYDAPTFRVQSQPADRSPGEAPSK